MNLRLLAVLCLSLSACELEDEEMDGGAGGGGEGGGGEAGGFGGGGQAGGTGGGSTGACPQTTGTVTHSGMLTGVETWAADSIHLVNNHLTVTATGSLTIEPCAQVLLSPGVWFYVDGVVVARGDAQHPISISGDGGRFSSIFVRAPGSLELAYATVSGGGGNTGIAWGSNLLVEGAWPVVAPLLVDHVTVRDALGYGIVMRKYAAFAAGSTDLTVTECGGGSATYRFPVRMSLNAVNSLPPGSYTGNAVDEIELVGENPHYTVEVDDVLRDRGVPYHVFGVSGTGELRVGAVGSVPTLTIEPGVVIKLDANGARTARVFVGLNSGGGQLIAVGTAQKPIVFTTTAARVAGAWIGVDFLAPLTAGNRMEFTRIEYAGAPGLVGGYACLPPSLMRDDAALRLFAEPAQSFFTNSTISDSLGHGVLSAWTGAQVDFKVTNTFTNVAGCSQVLPKAPPNGSCPSTPACQ